MDCSRKTGANRQDRITNRAPGNLGGRNGPAHIARRAGEDGVRRRHKSLQRVQGGERVGTVGPHTNCQPRGVAGKNIAEIQGGGEEPVGDAHGQIGDRYADLAAAARGIGQRKLKIINAGGGPRAIVQPALIAERRALRVKVGLCEQAKAQRQ